MTADEPPRDRAGRALYEKGQSLLPGLGQPPAPPWEELDEPVRERWRRNAENAAPGDRPIAPARRATVAGSPHADAPHLHR